MPTQSVPDDNAQPGTNYNVTINGGTVNLNGINPTITQLNLQLGTLAGTDTLTTSGLFSWSNAGSSGGEVGAAGAPGPTIDANGGISITGLAGSITVFASGTINNAATTTFDAFDMNAFGGNTPGTNTVFNNLAGATFNAQRLNNYYGNSSAFAVPDMFNDAGKFVVENSEGNGIFAEFNNSGSVILQGGGLDIFGGGTESGSFSIGSGLTLLFGLENTFTFTKTAAITGPGGVQFGPLATYIFNSGATVAPGGTVDIEGGQVQFNSPQTFNALTLGTGRGPRGGSGIGTSMIDLTNTHIIIDYGTGADPRTNIISYLKSGYNGGTWNGVGIDSSTAAAAGPNGRYGVGYADGADGLDPNLTSGQLEVAFALYGDITLQGYVGGADLSVLANNFGKSVTGGWANGDFNGDGVVNGADFALLAENFGLSTNGDGIPLPQSDWDDLYSFAAAHGLMADVPEPSTLGLLALCGISVVRRRRRFH